MEIAKLKKISRVTSLSIYIFDITSYFRAGCGQMPGAELLNHGKKAYDLPLPILTRNWLVCPVGKD